MEYVDLTPRMDQQANELGEKILGPFRDAYRPLKDEHGTLGAIVAVEGTATLAALGAILRQYEFVMRQGVNEDRLASFHAAMQRLVNEHLEAMLRDNAPPMGGK